MFQLIVVATGEPVNDVVYTSAEEATAAFGQYPGVKLRLRRVVDDSWKLREAARFEAGEYEQLPDYIQVYVKPEHFAHVSKKDPIRLAFTASPEDGMADKQTILFVSSYLTRYASDRLASHTIRDLASRYEARLVINDSTLVVSHERSAFRFAYNDQPVKSESSDHISCMAKSARSYTGSMNLHPAEAYSTDEDGLHIAYTIDPNHPKSVTARAVVWPMEMTFVKVYGLTEQYRAALIMLLVDRGYSRSSSFYGAPLARIPADHYSSADGESGAFLMPYIDGDDRGINDHYSQERFYISNSCDGDYVADDTCGVLRVGGNYVQCDNCDGRIDEDEDDTYTVNRDQTWCSHCYESGAFTCERTGDAFSDDVARHTVNVRHRSWSGDGGWRNSTQEWSESAVQNYAFYCDNTEEYYSHDSFTAIEVVVNSRGHTETWCAERTEDEWFQCDDCEKYFVTELMAPDQPDNKERCNDCHEANVAELEGRGYPVPTYIRDERQIEMALAEPAFEPLF